jgi:ribosomal protein L15E
MTYTITTQHHVAQIHFDKQLRVIKSDPQLAWMMGRSKREVEDICIRRGYTYRESGRD